MRFKKHILFVLTLLVCFSLAGCNKKEVIREASCNVENDTLYDYELSLAEDGKTINEIRYIQKVDEEFFKKYLPDEDLDYAYEGYKNQFEYYYYTITDGNENLSWFKAKLDITEDEHYAKLTMVFDLDNEYLDVNEENTKEFLHFHSIDQFYDEDEKAFLYDAERINNNFKQYDANMLCTVDKVETK